MVLCAGWPHFRLSSVRGDPLVCQESYEVTLGSEIGQRTLSAKTGLFCGRGPELAEAIFDAQSLALPLSRTFPLLPWRSVMAPSICLHSLAQLPNLLSVGEPKTEAQLQHPGPRPGMCCRDFHCPALLSTSVSPSCSLNMSLFPVIDRPFLHP